MNKQKELLEKILSGGSIVYRSDNFRCLSCKTDLSLLQHKFKRKGRKQIRIILIPKRCPICGNKKFKRKGYSYSTYSGEVLLEKKIKERIKKKERVR